MPNRVSKREFIVQAAIEVFGRSDFQSSSISEIARRANVAEGTIYQYFKNKEDLFFSIPVEKSEEFDRELGLHLEGISGALNKIKKYIWYFLFFFEKNPHYARIIFLELRVNKNFTKTNTYGWIKKTTGKILDIIKEGQEEGIIRRDMSIYLMRHLILGTLEHVVTRWLLKDQEYGLTGQYNEICDLIINGIRVNKPPTA